ncbi:MAG: hypothetical protein KDI39_13775 [Pseudomonadales bacterium]|nr:hypothetical protein [Pseudomonadales bacterium]
MLKSFGTVAVIGISLLLAGCPQLDTYHAPHRLDGDIYAGKIDWLSPNIPALNVALMACALQDAEHNKQAMELKQTPPDQFKLAPVEITQSPRCKDRLQEASDLWEAIETCNANREWQIPRCLELDQWMHTIADGEKERENGVNVYILRNIMTKYFSFTQPTITDDLPSLVSIFWPSNLYFNASWQMQDRRAIMHKVHPLYFWIPALLILIGMSLFALLIFVYRHKIIFWYQDFDYKRQEKAEKKRYLLQKHEREIAEKIRQEEQAAQQKSDEERRERIKAQQARDEQLLLKKEAEKLQKMDEEAAKVKKMLDDSFDF